MPAAVGDVRRSLVDTSLTVGQHVERFARWQLWHLSCGVP
jgi:hypothetical protein